MAARPEPTDADVTQLLRSVSAADLDEIRAALAEVAAEGEHVRWEGGGQRPLVVDGVERQVHHLPYPVYSDGVERLRRVLGVFVVPFPWMDWDGLARYRTAEDVARAPAVDAVRLITAILRSERFGDGSIGGALDKGLLQAAAQRVLAWREEHGAR